MRHTSKASVLAALARKYHLTILYLFGSQARGDTRAGSDIDIAYYSRRSLTLAEKSELTYALRHALKIKTPTVDLIDLATVPPLLAYLIATEGRKLYGNAAAEDLFYRRALQRYLDAKPLFRLTQEYVQAHSHL